MKKVLTIIGAIIIVGGISYSIFNWNNLFDGLTVISQTDVKADSGATGKVVDLEKAHRNQGKNNSNEKVKQSPVKVEEKIKTIIEKIPVKEKTEVQESNVSNPENKKQEIKPTSIGPMYKPGVTKDEIQGLKTVYENKLSEVEQFYGTSYQKVGGPTYTGNVATDLPIANKYYNRMNSVINQEWGSLMNVLTRSAFLKLQAQEKQWIATRDAEAKEQCKNSNEKGVGYQTTRGQETEKRIIELYNTYL